MAQTQQTDFLALPIVGTDLIAFFRKGDVSKPLYVRYSTLLQALIAAAGTGSTFQLNVRDEGVVVSTNAQFLNFVGDGVVVTPNGTGVDINIAAAPAETADNGLTKDTATNTQWGGTLLKNTTINANGFYSLFTGTISGGTATAILRVINGGSSPTLLINNSGGGNGIRIAASSGTALFSQSSSGFAGYFFAPLSVGIYVESYANYSGSFTRLDASTNSVLGVLEVFRGSNGGVGANGIGASIDFKLGASNGGANMNMASRLVSSLTDATIGTLKSRFAIRNQNNAVEEEQLNLQSTGQFGLNKYGVNTFVGNPATAAGFDSSGNVIEFQPSGKRWVRTTDGTAITGTTANSVSATQLIPAGSLVVGNWIRITARVRKTGVVLGSTFRLYVNATADLAGSPLLIGTFTIISTSLFNQITRHLEIKSSTVTEVFPSAVSLASDIGASSSATTNVNIDWTLNRFFVFALQNSANADSTVISGYTIEQL